MEKKIWFITGISSGMGEALAAEALKQGDFVIGTFRKAEQVENFNHKHKGKAKAFLLDVTHFDEAERVIAEVKEAYGRIDVLVNNAGYGIAGAIEETSLEEARQVFEANFFGALHLTQLVLPVMRQQKRGHIFQISSHGGIKAFPGFGIYNASKFALEGFSEALAQEVASLGIKVIIVEPGPFRTSFAGSGFVLAKRELPDYGETAGSFRRKIKSVDGKQEGDPLKAAQIIFKQARAENPPLRLPLGKTALMTISAKLKSVAADVENTRKLAESAVYEE